MIGSLFMTIKGERLLGPWGLALATLSLSALHHRYRKNQACYFLWLIHLYKMSSPGQEKQIRCGKDLVKFLCHPFIQIRIGVTENDSNRSSEPFQLGDHF